MGKEFAEFIDVHFFRERHFSCSSFNLKHRALLFTLPPKGKGVKFKRLERDPLFLNAEPFFEHLFHRHQRNGRGKFFAVVKAHIRKYQMFPCRQKRFKEKVSAVIAQIGVVAADLGKKIKGVAAVNAGERAVVEPQNGNDFCRDRAQRNQ